MDELIAESSVPKNETTFINETLSVESFNRRMFRTAILFDEFCTPLLCLFGIIGNFLSLAVFFTDSKYKTKSASLYLSALAISDTGFLLSLFAVWLEGVVDGGSIITTSDFSCSLFMYLGQVTCFLSVYLTVAFTIERYMAVSCPLSKARSFTKTKAKRCVAVITIIALLVCSYACVIAKLIKYPLPVDQPQPSTSSSLQTWDEYHHSDERENGSVVVMLETTLKVKDRHRDRNQVTWVAKNNSDLNVTEYHEEYDLRMNSTGGSIIPESIIPDDYDYICSVPERFHKISEIANYCDTIITFVIPFAFVTFFNIRIAKCVWRLKILRENIVATPSQNTCGKRCSTFNFLNTNDTCRIQEQAIATTPTRAGLSQHSQQRTISIESLQNKNEERKQELQGKEWRTERSGLSNIQHLQERKQQKCCNYNSTEVQVTKTLLLVSSVFLVLNLPSHLIRCALFIQNVTGTKEGQETLRAMQPWANILYNTIFSVNFLLYCVSGKSFRSSLRRLLLRIVMGREHLNHQAVGNVINERFN